MAGQKRQDTQADTAKRHRTFPKSVQPGKPRLGTLKQGWSETTFGEQLIEERRPVKMADESCYDLVTVKRSRGGIAKRSTLKGNKISVKSQFSLEEGDFLISKRQIVHGACGLVTKEFEGSIVSNEYSVLRNKPTLDIRFLNYFSHTIYFQQTCFHSSIGVHVEKMIFKLEDWFKWKFNLPSLPEQRKIADFLSVVDDRITGLSEKKQLLQDYKKGVMQQIFSQTIRFQDDNGHPFPDWEEKRLGDVGTFKSGIGFSNIEQGGVNGIPFYKVSDMNLSGNEYIMSTSNNYVSGEQIHRLKYKPITQKSIIFAKVGAAVFLERKRIAQNFLIDNNMMAFIPSVNIGFMRYVFDRLRLSKFAQIGALPSYNGSDLATIKIILPKNKEEQQKIANFLSAIDDKITATENQLAHMQSFKNGLLQKLFV